MNRKILWLVSSLLFLTCVQAFSQPADTARLKAQLDKYLHLANRFYQFNGSAVLAYKGQVLLNKGYGYRDFKQKQLNTPNTHFRIGSVTKSLTATLILALEAEGKLALQDKVSKFFPELFHAENITIEHLLSNTSGLADFSVDLDRADSALISHPVPRDELIHRFMGSPLAFQPGSTYKYSNNGYFLLGMIAEKVSGMSWEEALRKNVFLPLGMRHSGFDFAGLKSSDKAAGYQAWNRDGFKKDIYLDSTIAYAAGTVYSNTSDMLVWAKAASEKKLLSPQHWEQAFKVRKQGYGLGWEVNTLFGKRFVGHSGGIFGFSAQLIIFPEDDLQVILLSNVHERTAVAPISKALASIVLGGTKPTILRSIAAQPSAELLSAYAGTYALDKNHKLLVLSENGKLFVESKTNQLPRTELLFAGDGQFVPGNVLLEMSLVFQHYKGAAISHLDVLQGGKAYRWKRVK